MPFIDAGCALRIVETLGNAHAFKSICEAEPRHRRRDIEFHGRTIVVLDDHAGRFAASVFQDFDIANAR